MDDLSKFIDDGIERAKKKGYRNHAGWLQLKAEHGVVEAVKRLVRRRDDTSGYTAMLLSGLKEHTLEAAVLQFPQYFDADTQKAAAERYGRNHA